MTFSVSSPKYETSQKFGTPFFIISSFRCGIEALLCCVDVSVCYQSLLRDEHVPPSDSEVVPSSSSSKAVKRSVVYAPLSDSCLACACVWFHLPPHKHRTSTPSVQLLSSAFPWSYRTPISSWAPQLWCFPSAIWLHNCCFRCMKASL